MRSPRCSLLVPIPLRAAAVRQPPKLSYGRSCSTGYQVKSQNSTSTMRTVPSYNTGEILGKVCSFCHWKWGSPTLFCSLGRVDYGSLSHFLALSYHSHFHSDGHLPCGGHYGTEFLVLF
uniref:Uncharacterized protein n=1 Tax=Eutreptiella gymnastica TaxID=73025 RepID=A0A7S1ISW8_9EUGL